MARVLHLSNEEFDSLYGVLEDTIDYLKDDLITTEDENGNEVEEDITEYHIYKVFKQMEAMV